MFGVLFCSPAAMGKQRSALASAALCWLWLHGCCKAVTGIVRSWEKWAHQSAQRPAWEPVWTDFTFWWAALRTELSSTSPGWRTKVRFFLNWCHNELLIWLVKSTWRKICETRDSCHWYQLRSLKFSVQISVWTLPPQVPGVMLSSWWWRWLRALVLFLTRHWELNLRSACH